MKYSNVIFYIMLIVAVVIGIIFALYINYNNLCVPFKEWLGVCKL